MEKKLTKKQIKEFTRIYIGSQMEFIDADNIGTVDELVSQDDLREIVESINEKGVKILMDRPRLGSPDLILKYVIENY